jgi:hypothetical protein
VNWLEKHVNEFVIPGIRTLARHDGKEIHDRDIKPYNGRVRASSACRFKEAGMIHAAVSSVVPKRKDLWAISRDMCERLGTPDTHSLVYELDSQNRVRDLGNHYPGFNGADVLHSFLCSTTRAIRGHLAHKDARVIYPGRDVWALEVMSQRRGVSSIYDPRISREIDAHDYAYKDIVDGWGVPDWGKALAFDSGYAGTVPRAIGRVAGVPEINIVMLSAMDTKFQVFPGHTGSRAKALALEYLAKYRKRCLVKDKTPTQPLADLEEFIKAALLTIWIWHHVSPKRLPSWENEKTRREKRKRGTLNISAGHSGIVYTPANWATMAGTGNIVATNSPWQTLQSAATTNTMPITVQATSTATGAMTFQTGTGSIFFDPNSTGTALTGGLW